MGSWPSWQELPLLPNRRTGTQARRMRVDFNLRALQTTPSAYIGAAAFRLSGEW
ncbi:MAG: hypothetical protein ACE149_06170 [Armatimonadota bacterium]